MRIGVVTTSYPMTSAVTAGAFVESLCRALVTGGHAVEVLAPEPAKGGPPLPAASEPPGPTERGTLAVRLVKYVWPRALARTFYGAGVPDEARASPLAWPGLFTFPPALVRAVRDRARGWDAAISHWAVPSALAVALAAPALPHVAFLHSADVHLLERLLFGRAAAARVARSARALAFSSGELRARFDRLAPPARDAGPRAVVPIGTEEAPVDEDERRAARAALGVDGLVVLALARHVRIKGLDVAVDALAGAHGVTLVLAGDGPERAGLEARARAMRAPVRWPGVVTGTTRRAWIAAADVVVVPSRVLPSGRTEGAPTVVFEALAAGRPVVASDVGGLAEVVRSDRGVLVAPEDAGALAAALRLLRDDPARLDDLRRGARGARVPRPAAAARFVLDAVGGARAAPGARSAEPRLNLDFAPPPDAVPETEA